MVYMFYIHVYVFMKSWNWFFAWIDIKKCVFFDVPFDGAAIKLEIKRNCSVIFTKMLYEDEQALFKL